MALEVWVQAEESAVEGTPLRSNQLSAPCLLAAVLSCASLCALPKSGYAQAAAPAVQGVAPGADGKAYVGVYAPLSSPEDAMAVYVRNGQLTYDTERDLPRSLAPAGTDEFASEQGPHLRFQRNSRGDVTGVAVVAGARVLGTFQRVSLAGTPLNHGLPYTRSEAMIPMRDGVKTRFVSSGVGTHVPPDEVDEIRIIGTYLASHPETDNRELNLKTEALSPSP